VPRTTARRRHLLTHLTAAVVVPGCAVLCWWQVTRALSGNTLSWAYVFEWPIFAGYAVFMWWKLIHEPPAGATDPGAVPHQGTDGAGSPPADDESAVVGAPDTTGDEEDEELASYNRYLEALNASGRRKHW